MYVARGWGVRCLEQSLIWGSRKGSEMDRVMAVHMYVFNSTETHT